MIRKLVDAIAGCTILALQEHFVLVSRRTSRPYMKSVFKLHAVAIYCVYIISKEYVDFVCLSACVL